jgi:hypothetical protein
MLFTRANPDDRKYAEESGTRMSPPAELFQAAKYALRKEWNKDRADSLAAEIIKSYPHCDEARQAEHLMREILGMNDSAAKADAQQRREPKLTPEQEANLQRSHSML